MAGSRLVIGERLGIDLLGINVGEGRHPSLQKVAEARTMEKEE